MISRGLHDCTSTTVTSVGEHESMKFKQPSPQTEVLHKFLITCRLRLKFLSAWKRCIRILPSPSYDPMIPSFLYFLFVLIEPAVLLVSSGKITYTPWGNGSTHLMWFLGDCPSQRLAKRSIMV